MPGLSAYVVDKLIDHLFGTAFTAPTNIWACLLTAIPAASATGSTITESAYTGYARVSTAGSDWDAASGGMIDNGNVITFPACTGGTSTVVGVALVDASTAGNLLAFGPLGTNPVAFAADGTTSAFYSKAHGYSDTNLVRVFGPNLPTGVDNATAYYVVSATTDTFQLSLTSGGAAIDLTAAGSGTIVLSGSLAISSGITPQFSAGTLKITLK